MQAQGLWIRPESLGVRPSFKGFRCPLGSDEEPGCTFGAQRSTAATKCSFFASLRMTCHPERSGGSAFLRAPRRSLLGSPRIALSKVTIDKGIGGLYKVSIGEITLIPISDLRNWQEGHVSIPQRVRLWTACGYGVVLAGRFDGMGEAAG